MEAIEKLNQTNLRLEDIGKRLSVLNNLFLETDILKSIEPKYAGFIYDDSIEVSTVFQSPNVTVTYALWKYKNKAYPEHQHHDSVEYLIILSGSFLVKFNDTSRIMTKGECLSLPVNIVHTCISLEDMSEMIGICIPPEKAYQREGTNG